MCFLLVWNCLLFFFLFIESTTTEIYTLSLHDALPIWCCRGGARWGRSGPRPRRGGAGAGPGRPASDRKSTRLNSSHVEISYAVFCLKKKKGQLPYNAHTPDWPTKVCR